jgi:hypothetical protein
MGISPWAAGAVLIVAAAVVSAALQPDDSPPAPGQTSGPCVKEAKPGTVKGLAVESTGWTTPLVVAHDSDGYWANPAGIVGTATETLRICVRHAGDGYDVWMNPGDAAGNRESNWVSVRMHPEGQK